MRQPHTLATPTSWCPYLAAGKHVYAIHGAQIAALRVRKLLLHRVRREGCIRDDRDFDERLSITGMVRSVGAELRDDSFSAGVHHDHEPVEQRTHHVPRCEPEIAGWIEEEINRRAERAAPAVPQYDDELETVTEMVDGVLKAAERVVAKA